MRSREEHTTDEREAAYLAGFFDGEGCIQLTRHVGGMVATIQMTNIDVVPLEMFSEQFGGLIIPMRVRSVNHTQAWQWTLSGKVRLLKFVDAMEPFLIVKQRELQLFKRFLLEGAGERGHHLTPEKHALREELFAELKKDRKRRKPE